MASVSPPSDGGSAYYRSLSELEDELKAETKKVQKNAEERASDVEEKYQRSLEKKDKELEETVKNVRGRANEAVAYDREASKADLDRRAQTYDRLGRTLESDKEDLKTQVRSLQEDNEALRAKGNTDIKFLESAYEHRLGQIGKEQEARAQKDAELARESSLKAYEGVLQDQRARYDQFRAEAAERYARLDRAKNEEANFLSHRADTAIKEAQRNYEHKESILDRSDTSKNDALRQAMQEKIESDARYLTNSHSQESTMLRNQIKDLVESGSAYRKEKGQGTQDAIREYDNDWRQREHTIAAAHEREIAALQNNSKLAEKNFAKQNFEMNRDKDTYFADIISKQNLENHITQKDIENSLLLAQKTLEQRMDKTARDLNQRHEARMDDSYRDRDIALEKQAKAYQETIRQGHVAAKEKIDVLERELQKNKTSDDLNVVSPAAEARIRKNVTDHYDRLLGTEVTRNKGALESTIENYSNRLTETVTGSQARETLLRQQSAAELQRERTGLLNHIADTEFMKNAALQSRETEHNRTIENQNRAYAQMFEKQRREYEEILQALKDDAQARLIAVREEADFNSKMAQRSFSARQNEIVREYDKRLADQKVEYETLLEDARTQSQRASREGERQHRQALEEQARGYEQKLAQLEFQHKERERVIDQNHREELEKANRAHALISKKKS